MIFKTTNSKFKINSQNQTDGLELLKTLKDESISATFFDPQYRGIMDKMKYGNEGERQKKRFLLKQMSEETIIEFIQEIDRVSKKSSYLFLWIDKFHLCEGVQAWIKETNFKTVDLITWDKEKMGMGYRTRKQCEYVLLLQKKPTKVKGHWTIKNIRDIWSEKIIQKTHPHVKPKGLQTELIKTSTKTDDFILDPCAGSYLILELAKELKRNFIGCDIEKGDFWD